jgi:hypothetical protein
MEDILNKYENLSSKKKVKVLESAISYMQQYNGRSVDKCIELAMIDIYPKLEKLCNTK